MECPTCKASNDPGAQTCASCGTALPGTGAGDPTSASSSSDAPEIASQPDPGWYADPQGLAQFRYWDGRQWTSHVSGPSPSGGDVPGASAQAAVPAGEPLPTSERRYRALRSLATLYAVLAWIVLILGGVTVLATAAQTENGDAGAIVVLGGLMVVVYFAVLLAASQALRAFMDIEANTRWTARLLYRLVDERDRGGA